MGIGYVGHTSGRSTGFVKRGCQLMPHCFYAFEDASDLEAVALKFISYIVLQHNNLITVSTKFLSNPAFYYIRISYAKHVEVTV